MQSNFIFAVIQQTKIYFVKIRTLSIIMLAETAFSLLVYNSDSKLTVF